MFVILNLLKVVAVQELRQLVSYKNTIIIIVEDMLHKNVLPCIPNFSHFPCARRF